MSLTVAGGEQPDHRMRQRRRADAAARLPPLSAALAAVQPTLARTVIATLGNPLASSDTLLIMADALTEVAGTQLPAFARNTARLAEYLRDAAPLRARPGPQQVRVKVRLPRDMHEWLLTAAREHATSPEKEIILLLARAMRG